MTKKSEFNAEEWSLVLEGPPMAALRVIAADRGGTIRESLSMGRAYTEARKQQGSSELLDAIVNDQPQIDSAGLKSSGDVAEATIGRLREAVAVLEGKVTTEEVEEYKRFAINLAQTAAGAHKEGGFLGIGGKEVSDTEKAALDELAAALGIEASSP